MLYLILLLFLLAGFFAVVRSLSFTAGIKEENRLNDIKDVLSGLKEKDAVVCEKNALLENAVEQRLALYNIYKDISRNLDERKVFSIFKERINDYIEIEDCKFLRDKEAQASLGPAYLKFPITINSQSVGYLVAKVKSERDREVFEILAHQFLIVMRRVFLYEKIQTLAIMDGLTNVFSRRHFLERFSDEIRRSRKFSFSFSFLMIDIDRFKDFNDQYGHLVGDAILREISKAIKDTVRQIDFVGRYGGEEFCVVLPEADKEQAFIVAERIRIAVESKSIKVYDEELKVTVSIGISTFPVDAQDPGMIIEASDKALYLSKETGRNRVSVYHKK